MPVGCRSSATYWNRVNGRTRRRPIGYSIFRRTRSPDGASPEGVPHRWHASGYRWTGICSTSVASGTTRRIVYVADTSCYGETGPRPITEDEPPRPSTWGRCLSPALDRLDGYVIAGLPIVTALPGWVYGNALWFRERVIEPVMAGRRVLQFGRTGPWVSPIHVQDCARALVHLAEHGEPGGRYFVVNNDPIRMQEFAVVFARLAKRPLSVWHVPVTATRLVVGPVLADYVRADAVFSNIRLRGIGFRFEYPTLRQGLEQVLGALDE